jgi:hypothetical protein
MLCRRNGNFSSTYFNEGNGVFLTMAGIDLQGTDARGIVDRSVSVTFDRAVVLPDKAEKLASTCT